MKTYVSLTAILLFGLFALACGSGSRADATENKTEQISTANNTTAVSDNAVSRPTRGMTNVNTALPGSGKDRDDLRASNSNRGIGNVDRKAGKSDDDPRVANANRKRPENKGANSRPDGEGKPDNDGDSDDLR